MHFETLSDKQLLERYKRGKAWVKDKLIAATWAVEDLARAQDNLERIEAKMTTRRAQKEKEEKENRKRLADAQQGMINAMEQIRQLEEENRRLRENAEWEGDHTHDDEGCIVAEVDVQGDSLVCSECGRETGHKMDCSHRR